MSQEQIDSLVQRMSSDPAFAATIAEAGTALDVQRVACEHGFDISLDEIGAVLSGLELSDAELEMVDGGDPPGGACQWSPIQQSSTW